MEGEPKIEGKEGYELRMASEKIRNLLKYVRSGTAQEIEIDHQLEAIGAHVDNAKQALENKD